MSDGFLRDTLKLDPEEFHKELKAAFDELSEKTHVRPNCAPTEPAKVEEFGDLAISAFAEIFDVVDDVRHQVEQAIAPNLQNEAATAFIRETINELDIIAGRYTTEGVLFNNASVVEIGSEFITYKVTGTVDVQLHYGGKSDTVEIDANFPFTCTIVAKVSEPFNFLSDMTKMEVDTSSWHDDGQEQV